MELRPSSARNFPMFNACFYACGDQQLERIDIFVINVPVVQLTTVCLMLILEDLFGLKSKHAYVTAAFLHAALGEDEKSLQRHPLVSSCM
ncbi:hypothetical protein ACHAXS_000768 [Conticribra weissflogii]